MFDAICQNKADQLFTLHVFVIFLIPALNGEKTNNIIHVSHIAA